VQASKSNRKVSNTGILIKLVNTHSILQHSSFTLSFTSQTPPCSCTLELNRWAWTMQMHYCLRLQLQAVLYLSVWHHTCANLIVLA